MLLGIAASGSKYTVPNGSGTQLNDSAAAIFTRGFPVGKFYLTADYLTDYPLQTAWSSTPTTLKQLAQTTQFATQLARNWSVVILTCFTFANGSTNWWRVTPTAAKLQAEANELEELAVHLRTTYPNTVFIIQTWEGDWAFMDAFVADTYVSRELVDRYAAFFGARKRGIANARAATGGGTGTVLMAFECNRVIDTRQYAARRRICRDIAKRIKPDIISWSAYDGTIDTAIGFGSTLQEWEDYTIPLFRKGIATIRASFPGVPIMIGEFGFPEVQAVGIGRDVGDMIDILYPECVTAGIEYLIYWQIFDNEELSPGNPRGFYIVKPDGSTSDAGNALEALL